MQQFEVEDSEGLCQCLKSLATDGNKHRAKNDRRKQRSIFREVLHYIEVRLKARHILDSTFGLSDTSTRLLNFISSLCSAERGVYGGDDQVWSGERLYRQLGEEKDL